MVEKKHSADLLFVLMLFLVFALVSFLLVSVGAQVYKKTAERADENYEIRTAFSYVANKIKYAPGEATIKQRAGVNTLVIFEMVEGEQYETCIYFEDGALKELFSRAGNSLSGGSEILSLADARFEQRDDMLIMTIETSAGREETLKVSLVK